MYVYFKNKIVIYNIRISVFSKIADKEAEIILYQNRVTDLEQQLAKRILENTENDKKLRREIESLSVKNSELESKVAEAASTVCIFVCIHLKNTLLQ